ncbi:gonadal somatic cell derived factor [Aulostomus maculatus]
MSCTFMVMMTLLGSSVVIAFVLQPPKEEPAMSLHRCWGESLQSIRMGFLAALSLQAEPRLPAGALDGIREQWRSAFNTTAHRSQITAVPGFSVPPDDGNNTSLKCCSMASEIFMKDLGWDNWVIHPASITIVECAPCNPSTSFARCALSLTGVQNVDSQVPCCQPTYQEMPIVYMDERSTVVIASMQLPHSCSCETGNMQQPSKE